MKIQRAAITMACLVASGAMAADLGNGVEYSGYGRGGAVTSYNKDNGVKRALTLGGDLQFFRLGNEGDSYYEVYVGKSFEAPEGVKYKFGYMPSKWNSNEIGTTQAFAEISGVSIAPEAKFWAGQRRLRIQDIHLNDHFLMNSGEYQGGGVMDLNVGAAKVGVTLSSGDRFDAKLPQGASANKLNVDIGGLKTNADGTLRMLLTSVNSSGFGSNGGSGISVVHNQSNFLTTGLTNSLFLQSSSGLAKITGEFIDLKQGGAAGAGAAVYGVKATRIADSINWQKGAFGGQALIGYQTSKAENATATTKDSSLGGRISYAYTNNFKLLVEAATTRRKIDGQAPQSLNKLTIAPTISIGGDFWSRPELRFYVTRANWNEAAAIANVSTFGSSAGTSATKLGGQTLAGVQFEMWF